MPNRWREVASVVLDVLFKSTTDYVASLILREVAFEVVFKSATGVALVSFLSPSLKFYISAPQSSESS